MNRDGQQLSNALMLSQVTQGPAWTITLDGQAIGCGGVVVIWTGVGHAWMRLSDAIAPHGRWMFKVVRATLRDIIRAYGLHRVEAEALEDSLRNNRWLEHLGFNREESGRARAFLPDRRTMVRYELVLHG